MPITTCGKSTQVWNKATPGIPGEPTVSAGPAVWKKATPGTKWQTGQRTEGGIVSRETYERYLASGAWQRQRTRRLAKDRHRCQGCCSEDNLHVHHLTYERFGDERITDLVTVCEACHDLIHLHQRHSRRDLATVTREVLSQLAAAPKTGAARNAPAHTPRHLRAGHGFDLREAKEGETGTWAPMVPHVDKAAHARRINGL